MEAIGGLPEMLVSIPGAVNPRILVPEKRGLFFFALRAASWRPSVFLEVFNLREPGNLFRPRRGTWILRVPYSRNLTIWRVHPGFRRECRRISLENAYTDTQDTAVAAKELMFTEPS